MLLIDNDVVAQVLTMRECIEVQEAAFAGLAKGEAIFRPRIDTYVPCDRDDGYYRFGTVEGASGGYYAGRLKSDIVHWPPGPDGNTSVNKECAQPVFVPPPARTITEAQFDRLANEIEQQETPSLPLCSCNYTRISPLPEA